MDGSYTDKPNRTSPLHSREEIVPMAMGATCRQLPASIIAKIGKPSKNKDPAGQQASISRPSSLPTV